MSVISSVAFAITVIAAAAIAGCVPVTSITNSGGAGGSGGGGSAGCTIPQAMQNVIATCTSCHGNSSSNIPRLTTVADFEASSPLGGTIGDRSLARMKNASSPMPPGKVPPTSEVTAFAAWIQGGYPLDCPAATTTGATVTSSGSTSSGSNGSGSNGSGGAGGAGGATTIKN